MSKKTLAIMLLIMMAIQILPIPNIKNQVSTIKNSNNGKMSGIPENKSSLTNNLRTGEIPISYVDMIGNYPGEVRWVDFIHYENKVFIVIIGVDYVAINGSGGVAMFSGEPLDYAFGDLDMDGCLEIVVLTSTNIYAFGLNLSVLWVEPNYDGVDRIYVGNITSPSYGMVVCWRNDTNLVAYYNYTGQYLGSVRISIPSSILNISDITHLGEYIFARNSYNSLICYWRYSESSASYVSELGVYSAFVKVGDSIFSVGYVTGAAKLYEIAPPPTLIKSNYSINDTSSWLPFVNSSREFLCFDVDGDGWLEFVLRNDSMIALIDIDFDAGWAPQYTACMAHSDVSINDGYIVVLSGENLKLCNKNMVVSIVISVVNSIGLSSPNGWVLCYGPYGEAYNITPFGEALPVFVDAGWRYGFWDDHFVVYQARMVVDVYPDEIKVYRFDEFLNYSFPITGGFVVVWMDGSFSIYLRSAGLVKDKISYPSYPVMGDYCVEDNTICLVRKNGTIHLITPTTNSTYYPNLQGNVSPIRVYHRNGGYYIAIVNTSLEAASINIYTGFVPTLTKKVNISPDEFEGFFTMGDIDGDGTYEYAYSLYTYNGSGVGYLVGIYDEGAIYEDKGYIVKSQPTYPECAVFSFYNSFVIRHPENKFIRFFKDGSTESHILPGDSMWASAGILISTGEIRLINKQGQVSLNLSQIYRGIGTYDRWTKSIVLAKNYTIYNITGSIDKASPTVSILSPEEGECINSSMVNISWEASDDLLLASLTLRVDDGEWIDVLGKSSYVVYLDREGNHTVYLNATDIANRWVCVYRTFVVDIPMELYVDCSDNYTWINRSWAYIEWYSYGYVENISIIANGSIEYFTERNLNGSYNLSLGEGYWDIEVRAMGHQNMLSRKIYLWIDLTPPTVSVLEPENNSVVKTNESFAMITLRINVTDNFGVERIVMKYGQYTIEASQQVSLVLQPGEYYFKIIVYDKAGNTAKTTLHIIVQSVGAESGQRKWPTVALIISVVAGMIVGVFIVRKRMLRH